MNAFNNWKRSSPLSKEEIALLRELAEQLKEKNEIQEQYITKLHGLLRELGLSGNED